MSVLDGRTYVSNSISSEERLSSIYARGKCIDLLIWIDQRYRLHEPLTENTERCSWMMKEYFLQQIAAIKIYKQEAENNGIGGSDSARNCTAEQLSRQLEMIAKIYPGPKKLTLPFMGWKSLAWSGVEYNVECKRQSYSTSKFLFFSG